MIDPAGGVLFASTNAARLPVEVFLADVRAGVELSGRRVECEFFAPAAPDFPTSKAEPAYLKTVWMRVGAVGKGVVGQVAGNGAAGGALPTVRVQTSRSTNA